MFTFTIINSYSYYYLNNLSYAIVTTLGLFYYKVWRTLNTKICLNSLQSLPNRLHQNSTGQTTSIIKRLMPSTSCTQKALQNFMRTKNAKQKVPTLWRSHPTKIWSKFTPWWRTYLISRTLLWLHQVVRQFYVFER